MPHFLTEEIENYINSIYKLEKNQRIFQITKSFLHHEMDRGCKLAGVKRIRIHDLRHSHVSLLISKKYDIFEVSKRIGHKSIVTTQNIYGHLFDGVQRTITNDLDQMRKGVK